MNPGRGLKIIPPQILDQAAAEQLLRRISISLIEGYSGIIVSFQTVIRFHEAAADYFFRELAGIHPADDKQKILFTGLSSFASHLALLYGYPVRQDFFELDDSVLRSLQARSEIKNKTTESHSSFIDASVVRYAVCPHCENRVRFGLSRTRICPYCQSDLRMNHPGSVVVYERL